MSETSKITGPGLSPLAQLPRWAKDSGWTEQDLDDEWKVWNGGIEKGIPFGKVAVQQHIVRVVSYFPKGMLILYSKTPNLAYQCAIEIVDTIRKAVGDVVVDKFTTPFGIIYSDNAGKYVAGQNIYDTFSAAAQALETEND